MEPLLTATNNPRPDERNALEFNFKDERFDANLRPSGSLRQNFDARHKIDSKSGFDLKSQTQTNHIAHFFVLFATPTNNGTGFIETGFASGRGKHLVYGARTPVSFGLLE